ncbi:hypothetical protein OG2516_18955 [Oceanicola granulosus HTCC2516]|uniref:Uncharacterized protein n=1 Tax=Oceanicola granulosus (strain ATCC BAA-861 / DSM 15982 / KCTC 12143 / HTCC2516) TaxID=314256 RepID=Q2CBS7_OCEGH|nr:hypothetical protein OG2516_18955 [Oceanicola granulosus HTCC2516]
MQGRQLIICGRETFALRLQSSLLAYNAFVLLCHSILKHLDLRKELFHARLLLFPRSP